MPADYEKIAEHCLRHKKISDNVLDQFLMPSVQWNANIYRISHEDWSGIPHFASAYLMN